MWLVLVVMATVDAEHVLKMAAAEDQDLGEAISAESADQALCVGVRVWGPEGRADHLDALGAEDLVEDVAELCVAVVNEETGTAARR